MSEQLDYARGHARVVGAASGADGAIALSLVVEDPDTIAELGQYDAGGPRDRVALHALRIGVLALRQARGQIDGEQIRRESELLMQSLQQQFATHAALVHDRVAGSLKEYFDPESGRFHERVNRLVRKDGELEETLRRQIGGDGSELARTLARSFGLESPLMKLLSPDESAGLCRSLRELLEGQLQEQRETILRQFSLDDKESALSRLVAELGESQSELTGDLQEKIGDVVREFSLDDENSALSRLVRNVDRAQRTITSEFSLDNEASALARLRKEVLDVLADHDKGNRDFQNEVRQTLERMVVQRAESARSTRHGIVFEDDVCELLSQEARKLGDVCARTGTETGFVKGRKVGDCVIELGPESATPGAKIVVEITAEARYQIAKAREELELARKNRGAQVGVFVYASKVAPTELAVTPLLRYGLDILVVWDPEDAGTDLFLRTALTLARALCIRESQATAAQQADFQAIDEAIIEIEKRTNGLAEIEKWADTIKGRSEDILERVRLNRSAIFRQVETLRKTMSDLRHASAAGE